MNSQEFMLNKVNCAIYLVSKINNANLSDEEKKDYMNGLSNELNLLKNELEEYLYGYNF